MPGTKLSDDWTHTSQDVTTAYQICLGVESCLMPQQGSNYTQAEKKRMEKNLINIRILGYLLIYGPTDIAREHIARTILTDKDGGSAALIARGGYYDQHFLRPFRKAKDHTPQISQHSRPSFIATLADVQDTIKTHPTTHKEAKKSALVRDNYKCMVTGATDVDSWWKFPELQKPDVTSIQNTQCAHIFSESTNADLNDERKRSYAANAWTIICQFGYQDIYDELGGQNSDIHKLGNIMTLSSTIHVLFDELKLWFEATDVLNSYEVCTNRDSTHPLLNIPKYVLFTTEHDTLPLPSPRYLEIHATYCRVAHMSGAADYYQDLDDDDPFVTKFRSFDPVGSDFSAALQARLLDLSERGTITTVSG